jgi:hypothetical protein
MASSRSPQVVLADDNVSCQIPGRGEHMGDVHTAAKAAPAARRAAATGTELVRCLAGVRLLIAAPSRSVGIA